MKLKVLTILLLTVNGLLFPISKNTYMPIHFSGWLERFKITDLISKWLR